MTDEQNNQKRWAPRRVSLATAILVPVAIGIAVAASTACIVLAIDRHDRAPIGEWVSDFFKSPGAAGLFAVMAAFLTLWGLLKQVGVARRNLDHQRKADESRAWWERFEWAAGRAVPKSKDEIRLPYNAVLSTLIGLARTASDDIQKAAVGAIMESAAAAEETARTGEEANGEPPTVDDQFRMDLLQKYVDLARESPARSIIIESELYELQVMEALRRILPPDSVFETNLVGADAIVEHQGRRIVVEIKYMESGRKSSPALAKNFRRQALKSLSVVDAVGAVVVVPFDIPMSLFDEFEDLTVSVWSSPNDDTGLMAAIDRAGA
ncbi:hypothetical protein [Brevibacterium casei]